MRLIFALEDLGIHDAEKMDDQEFKETVDDAIRRAMGRDSNYEYGWKTDAVHRNPGLIKAIATAWNEQVRNDFMELVSDPERLRGMTLDTAETMELARAANAMDDVHDFCGYYHVIERNDHIRDIEFHTLIHPFTLSRIQAHPELYVLVTGEVVILV